MNDIRRAEKAERGAIHERSEAACMMPAMQIVRGVSSGKMHGLLGDVLIHPVLFLPDDTPLCDSADCDA